MKLNLEHTWIYWFHLLFVAPLLIYIGYSESTTPKNLFALLFSLGIVVAIYHFYKLIAG
jgi:hypothetical protein